MEGGEEQRTALQDSVTKDHVADSTYDWASCNQSMIVYRQRCGVKGVEGTLVRSEAAYKDNGQAV